METPVEFKCVCGEVIPDDGIDISEIDGDDGIFVRVNAYCDVCKKDYEASSWGFDYTKADAKELLNEWHS